MPPMAAFLFADATLLILIFAVVALAAFFFRDFFD